MDMYPPPEKPYTPTRPRSIQGLEAASCLIEDTWSASPPASCRLPYDTLWKALERRGLPRPSRTATTAPSSAVACASHSTRDSGSAMLLGTHAIWGPG